MKRKKNKSGRIKKAIRQARKDGAEIRVAVEAFLGALFPAERWTPSQWAEKAPRRLGDDVTSEPGDWKNDRTPYLVGIMDAAVEPGVEEIVVLKGAQVGYSEATRNLIGFWIDLDPGPTLVVMPDQKSAEELIEERVKPLLKSTPAVARHVSPRSWDTTKTRIRLDTMSLFVGWAGSSQALKSRPIRYLVLEEPDEYPASSGTGGDPISKAMKRVTTYADKGRARVLFGGTPTTRLGNVQKRWEITVDKRFFWVPCPHCGKYQRMEWKRFKWPKLEGMDRARQADAIESGNLAWYACEHCDGRIDDHHKPGMLRRGVWAGADQVVNDAGEAVGPRPRSKRVGFFLPSYYSPWVTFSKLAAEWILAQDDPELLMDFVNQRLAEPFETVSGETKTTVLEEKANGAPARLVVPSWTRRIVMTADTQGNDEHTGYFYYVIRAWGLGWKSRLLDAGAVSTREELYQLAFARQMPVEGTNLQVCCHDLLVDSGGPRWQEVYSFALSDPAHVHPTKGSNRKLAWPIEKRPQRDHGILLWEIDTQQTKDQLYRLIHDEDRTRWTLCDGLPGDYCKQMTSEHKVLQKGGAEIWQSKPGKPPNHYWDCEQQQIAAAWFHGMGMSEPVAVEKPTPESKPDEPRISSTEWMNRHKKW